MEDFFSTLSYSRILRQLGSIACAALFLASCSSGGGGEGGGTPPAASSSSSGTFVDSPVQGLGYKSLPSGLVGKTDATGQYRYMPGDMVTFDIGGRVIGTVLSGAQVTPLSIFGATNITDPSVVNLAQLLLGLGRVVNNVIQLPQTIMFPPTLTLNFASPTFDADVQAAGVPFGTEQQALAHLQTSFKTLGVTVDNSGTVTSNPAGINCTVAGTCSFAFVADTVVTLTAIGNGFIGWRGAGCSGTGTCVVTMNSDTAVTAPFPGAPPPGTLTISRTGTGTGTVNCSVNGGLFGGCAASYPNLTGLILQGVPDNGSTFSGWSLGTGNATVCNNTAVNCPLTLTADSAVTANFVLNTVTFSLTATPSSSNSGGGTIACSTTRGASFGDCADVYNAGTNLTLQATPDGASNFSGWGSGSGSGSGSPSACNTTTGPCNFVMTANSSITANFNQPTLTVVVNGTGSVSSTPAGIDTCPTTSCLAPFGKNTSVTLTASGAGFSGWSGGCSGTSSTCIVNLTVDTTVTASFVPTSSGYVYPLTVDPTSRYLVDRNGKPFLLVGDAAWSLFAALSDSDADVYLESRRQLGFTAVLANLIEHQYAASAPKDFYGIPPFTGQTFTTPNDAYFAHVDHIVQSAAGKGIVILLDPLYLGFNCDDEGWCTEVQNATISDMTAWGQYVGDRYKAYDNIVWVIGGDMDPTQVKTKVQAFVDGIFFKDTRHPFTAHNTSDQMAVTPWPGATWLNVNSVYTYGNAYPSMLSAYSTSPTKPVFLIEAAYENEHGVSLQELRAQSYWSVLSGGFGHVFGNCPIWAFGFTTFCSSTNWNAELNSAGSVNMQHFAALFNSRHWHTLVPDTSQTILTAGAGAFGGSDYATAAYAADGSSIIVYLPSSRQITVSGAHLADSTMIAWWYNPSNGVATRNGTTYPSTGTQDFTPPSFSGDWVLVLDSANLLFPAPGQ